MADDRYIARLEGAELVYPSPEGDVRVLAGIDLTVEPGEILAVTGPSGSGKSSLVAVLGGLERPTGGRALVLGTDMRKAPESERTRLRRDAIGVVFQAYHLVPAMTAVENVALPLVLGRVTDARRRAAELLDAVGLGHRLGHRPAALSGGEQQRVAIARAFAAGPRLVLADEPTGNLDQKTGEAVASLMFRLVRDTGAAMVLVTHDPLLAARCDRRVALEAGRVAADAPSEPSHDDGARLRHGTAASHPR